MRASVIASIVLVIIILAAGGWWYMSIQNTSTATPTDTNAVQQPVVDVQPPSVIGGSMALYTQRHEEYGSLLTAFNYMTLYTSSNDKGSESTCYDQCATNWPPYVVAPQDDLTHITAGVIGKVDYTLRTDGSHQITYNGKPLYFYSQDKNPGDIKGQGIDKAWSVVKP